MKTKKIETIQVNQAEITVDVTSLPKTNEIFFNGTDMAKIFGKRPVDFLRLESTREYMYEIFKGEDSHLKSYDDLIRIRRGKYGGTWLHNELAFEFAGWCSAIFRRNLHKWTEDRLRKEADWQRQRLEAKTGFRPMTDAILRQHDPAKHYHFKNEIDLINRIALDMPAKKFKEEYQVDNVRDACTAEQLKEIGQLQMIDTGLIEIGMDYQERKERLTRYHEQNQEGSLMQIENALCSRQALQRA